MAEAVTVDDILDELAATYKVELRQANDIDAKQLGRVLGVSARHAGDRMTKIAAERADFERIEVYDQDSHSWKWVLRKVA
jgi:hypothetical protein